MVGTRRGRPAMTGHFETALVRRRNRARSWRMLRLLAAARRPKPRAEFAAGQDQTLSTAMGFLSLFANMGHLAEPRRRDTGGPFRF